MNTKNKIKCKDFDLVHVLFLFFWQKVDIIKCIELINYYSSLVYYKTKPHVIQIMLVDSKIKTHVIYYVKDL